MENKYKCYEKKKYILKESILKIRRFPHCEFFNFAINTAKLTDGGLNKVNIVLAIHAELTNTLIKYQ